MLDWLSRQHFFIKYIHVDEKIGVKSVERLDLMCDQFAPMDLDVFKEAFYKHNKTEPLFLRVNELQRIKLTAKNIRTYFKKIFLRDSEALKSSKNIYSLYMIANYSKLIYSLLIPLLVIRFVAFDFTTDSIFYLGITTILLLFGLYLYTNRKFKEKLCESVKSFNTRYMRPHRFS